jgi:hypothetical protein
LRGRIDANGSDLPAWTATWPTRMRELLEGPMAGSLLHLTEGLGDDIPTRTEVEGLLLHLIAGNDGGFDDTLISVVDLMQLWSDDLNLVPLLQALAPALAPPEGTVPRTLDLFGALAPLEGSGTLVALLPRLVEPREGGDGETVLEALLDIFVQVNRTKPGSDAPLSAGDYDVALRTFRDALQNDKDGLERLYAIIANR